MPNPIINRRLLFSRSSGVIPYDPDAQNYFDRLPNPATTAQKNLINTYVLAIKSADGITSLSSKYIKIHIRAGIGWSRANALVNLAQNNYNTTEVNSTDLAWGVLGFFSGQSGSFGYLNEHWVSSTDGGYVFDQDRGTIGIYIHRNEQADEYLYGGTGDGVSTFIGNLYKPKRPSTNNTLLFCNNTGTGSAANTGNIDGISLNVRTGANQVIRSRNSSIVETLVTASSGLSTRSLYSLCGNIDTTPSEPSAKPQSLFMVAGGNIDYAAFESASEVLAIGMGFSYSVARNFYVFGMSLTVGTGVTNPNVNKWTTLLALQKGYLEFNLGESGTTLQHAIPVDSFGATNMLDRISEIPTYNSATDAILMFDYGINDGRLYDAGNIGYGPTNMQSNSNTIIDAAIAKSWPTSKICLLCGSYANPSIWAVSDANYISLQAAAQASAVSRGIVFINDYAYIRDNGGLANLNDTLHYNDTGATKRAAYVASLLP